MQWWCSAQTGAWDWTWQPYVGVWISIGAIIWWYVRARRRFGRAAPDGDRANRLQIGAFAAGVLSLWAGLDWPLGPLGASYLASVHMVQYLLIGVLAPALFLIGVPDAAFEQLRRWPGLMGFLEAVTQPVVAFISYSIIISIVHWPTVVDTLMPTQIGSFTLDLLWLLAGLLFWWPVLAPVPARPRFNHLLKIMYLGLNIVIVRPPVMLLFYSKFPAYATYELAPPIVGAASPLDDQQLAGAIMKAGSAWIMVIGITLLFIMWHRESQSRSAEQVGH